MARASEFVFVDPSVSDLDTMLRCFRPEVEAIVLDAARPPARQIASALEGFAGLDAVHVIAHGAPGRVNFGSGKWSAETLEEEAADLAAIGGALESDGDLLLWSCCTGEGSSGRAFVTALSRATGAPVVAATTHLGQTSLGGRWELTATAKPPLTAAGIVSYSGTLAAFELVVTGTLPNGNTTKTITHFIIDTTRNGIVSQVVLPDAVKQNNSVSLLVKVPSLSGSFSIGTFDDAGNFQMSTFLRVSNPAGDHRPIGAVGR
jgi:hypothetical protein